MTRKNSLQQDSVGHDGNDRNLMEPCSCPQIRLYFTQVPAAFGGRDCDSVGGNLLTSQWHKSLQRLRWGMYGNIFKGRAPRTYEKKYCSVETCPVDCEWFVVPLAACPLATKHPTVPIRL